MIARDLIVEVRNLDLIRVAQLTETDVGTLTAVPRANDVGGWELTLPNAVIDPSSGDWVRHAAAAELRKEGAGIIVTGPHGVILSGPMTSATYNADTENISGEWKFTGVSDAVLLADAEAYPSPTIVNPAAQVAANDTRTASAEELLRQYVSANITPAGAPAGRVVGLRTKLVVPIGGTRGPQLTKSPRFQNLLELCREIAFAGNLRFDIVQIGSGLEFRIWEPVDRSKFVRMDMENDLLKTVTYGYGAPSTTLAIVAGQGQGTERTILSRQGDKAAASEALWGRRVERFIDQRQTDAPDELAQAGDDAIVEGAASATGLQVTPTDTDAMLFLRDWNVGDLVGVVVEGQEVAAPVTEAALSIDGASVVFVATLGSADAFDPDAAAQTRASATSSRVSSLERNDAPLPARIGDVGKKVDNFNTAIEPGWYWGYTATNQPTTGGNYWIVETSAYVNANTLVQQAVRADLDTAIPSVQYRRTKDGGATWSAWSYGTIDGAQLTSGTINAARIPGLDGSKITAGKVAIARLPNMTYNATLGRAYFGAGPGNGTDGTDAAYLGLTDLAIDTTNSNYLWFAAGSSTVFSITRDGDTKLGGGKHIVADPVSWAQAAGAVTSGSIAGGATAAMTVTFPPGRFTQPPIVTATVRSGAAGQRGVSVSDSTTSGMTVYLFNGATGPIINSVGWIAVQMSASNASG